MAGDVREAFVVEHGIADEVVPLVLEPRRRQLEPEGGLDEQELEYDTDDDDQDDPESPHRRRCLLNAVIGAARYGTACRDRLAHPPGRRRHAHARGSRRPGRAPRRVFRQAASLHDQRSRAAPPREARSLDDGLGHAIQHELTRLAGPRVRQPEAVRDVPHPDARRLLHGRGRLEDTVARRVERALGARGCGSYEVVNAGTASYSPILEYLRLRQLGPILRPDLLVLNFD